MEYFSKFTETDVQSEYLKLIKNHEKHDNDTLHEYLEVEVYYNLYGIPDPYTCPNTSDFCEIFETKDMGRGVKAKTYIAKGTNIGCYLGTIKHITERRKGDDWRYDFVYGLRGYYVDGSKCKSMMSLLNHSDIPNVNARYHIHIKDDGMEEVHIVFYALRDISPDSELFIDYGEEYWITAERNGIYKKKDTKKRNRDDDEIQSSRAPKIGFKTDRDEILEHWRDFYEDGFYRDEPEVEIEYLIKEMNMEESDWLERGGM
jgi:hypothetical protein